MPTTILMIEDDIRVSELLTIVLERQGYEVIPAYTASEGLDYARHNKPNLVLMDIMLPDQNGLDTYPFLVQLVENTPILLMSANRTYRDSLAHYNIDDSMFLEKPINVMTLANVVRHYTN